MTLAFTARNQSRVDLGFLDERIQDVENTVRAPRLISGVRWQSVSSHEIGRCAANTDLSGLRQHVHLLFRLVLDLTPPEAEALVLIYEFVDNVP